MMGSIEKYIGKVYCGDNLQFMNELPDGEIDLIYIDPPFGINQDVLYNIPSWKDTDFYSEVVYRVFSSVLGSSDLKFLSFMYPRLERMRELLSDSGSIYVHTDWHVGHYIKILLDIIFGKVNFRNEIVWCYTSGGKSVRHFAKKHDTILFYSKTKDYIFNVDAVRVPYSDKTVANCKPGLTGSSYTTTVVLNPNGKVPEDYWNIAIASKSIIEYLRYPKQKPLKLLERIIKVSSNENSVVADFFAGSGTTADACKRLCRGWIYCDSNKAAVDIASARLV